MSVTDPTELPCGSPFMKDISYTAYESQCDPEGSCFSQGREERIIVIENDTYCELVIPSKIIKEPLCDRENWGWFDTIRNDERFKKCLERVEKLIVYKT